MVVQSLEVVPQQLMVSPKVAKSSESKIALENGGEGAAAKNKSRESKDMPMQRRASARIQAKHKTEELLARKKTEVDKEKVKSHEVTVKSNKRSRKSLDEEGVARGEVVLEPQKKKPVAHQKLEEKNEERKVESGNVVGLSVEKSDFVKVKETIRLFNKHYLLCVQEEAKRCSKAEAERKAARQAKGSKSKRDARLKGSKTTAKRPDLKAVSKRLMPDILPIHFLIDHDPSL
ncbi:histone-lysine N-methyltransferase, H3 lysine-9 specific SUVH4-like [Abrus precatorius]|uniref:Histone-lysine N-methyltransferase, H3 lysine-9 specific SUVH4-like n=1 Tax=Abrus precatorius TaxID=3816 RepID=A0A8B8L4L7_ABRPR|nr:histone-lysine N-methyltransferase, H3 lysine-9 specific SUVH4-like [Abrus precatorius]